MPLLMKHIGPLWGIWKIEEPSEVLLALLMPVRLSTPLVRTSSSSLGKPVK